MTILYQIEMYDKNKFEYNLDEVIKENLEIQNEFVNEIVNGVINNRKEIDDIANKYLKDWTRDRLETIGASILRMAIYEVNYMDTPKIVVINEAIDLAKKYSDDNVRKMINAVLDKIVNE